FQTDLKVNRFSNMNPRLFVPLSLLLLGTSLSAAPILTRLHSFGFSQASAANPSSRLTQASDGYLYGVTPAGGQDGFGTVFRLSGDGSDLVFLKDFTGATNDGRSPFGALIEGSDGMLYGTTEAGGPFDAGTIFRL